MQVKRLNHYFVFEKMDTHHIGVLPEPDVALAYHIISTFGILSNNSNQEDCRFCLSITGTQAIKLPCCGHHAHIECFRTWALSSLNVTSIRCAYCRAVYNYSGICFLCLKKVEDHHKVKYTTCCIQCKPKKIC